MKKRKLGEIEVSAIGMGCMAFSHGYGKIPPEQYSMREIEEAAAAWREEQKALRRARREAKSGTGKDCSNADGAKDA